MLLLMSVFLSGLSLCLLIYLLFAPTIKEEKSPLFFKKFSLLSPWIMVLSQFLMPFLSWKYQINLRKKMSAAGYANDISIQEIVGLQALGALVFAFFNLLIGYALFETAWVKWFFLGVGFLLGSALPLLFLKSKEQERKRLLLKNFPFFLDMITLCVESGSNLQVALMMSVQSLANGPLRDELSYALNDMRTGTPRIEALKAMAKRCNLSEVKQWVASVAQAEALGASLGTTLRIQADQFRQERFFRAEKKAAEAPVKLLFPLVIFIFPCTFLVLAYPIAMRFSAMS